MNEQLCKIIETKLDISCDKATYDLIFDELPEHMQEDVDAGSTYKVISWLDSNSQQVFDIFAQRNWTNHRYSQEFPDNVQNSFYHEIEATCGVSCTTLEMSAIYSFVPVKIKLSVLSNGIGSTHTKSLLRAWLSKKETFIKSIIKNNSGRQQKPSTTNKIASGKTIKIDDVEYSLVLLSDIKTVEIDGHKYMLSRVDKK